MTKQEIDQARKEAASGLIRRSGVGYIFAINTFTPKAMELMQEQTLSGSESEAIVKMALQLAFQHGMAFRQYVKEQMFLAPHEREFRVVR